MPKSVNKTILLGHVGRDPETKSLPSGTQVVNLSLATSDKSKDETRTEWHNLVAFGKTAEILSMYVKKGSQLYVEGRIQTRSWEKDGVKQFRTEIIVSEVCLLGGKEDSGHQRDGKRYEIEVPAKRAMPSMDDLGITDQDIPF